MQYQRLIFYPWDISHKIKHHWKILDHTNFYLSTLFFCPLWRMHKSRPTTSSVTSCIISVCTKMTSLPILVVVLFCQVPLLTFQDPYAIIHSDILVIPNSSALWIGTHFLVSHLAITLLLGMVLLVSSGPFFWKLMYLMVCRFQTGSDPLDHCHILPQDRIIIIESWWPQIYLKSTPPLCKMLFWSERHRWELPVIHYHKIMVIYPYPLLVVITQFFSWIIFIHGCIRILTGSPG